MMYSNLDLDLSFRWTLPLTSFRTRKSECFLKFLKKKFKGSRGHLAQFSGGGVENQAECLKFWKKNSRTPAST